MQGSDQPTGARRGQKRDRGTTDHYNQMHSPAKRPLAPGTGNQMTTRTQEDPKTQENTKKTPQEETTLKKAARQKKPKQTKLALASRGQPRISQFLRPQTRTRPVETLESCPEENLNCKPSNNSITHVE